jgi:hypothetical protein
MRNIEQRLWWQTRAMTRREVITKAITRQLTWGAAERDCGNQCPAYAAATPKCRTLGDGLNLAKVEISATWSINAVAGNYCFPPIAPT